jgi:ATP-dependent Lon protease
MPRKNEKDLEEIPDESRRGLEFVFIDRVEEALEHGLTSPPPAPRKAPNKSAPRRKKKAPRRRSVGLG